MTDGSVKLASFSFDSASLEIFEQNDIFSGDFPVGEGNDRILFNQIFNISESDYELLQSSIPLSFMIETHKKGAEDERYLLSIRRVLDGKRNECHCLVLPGKSPVPEEDIIRILEDKGGEDTLFQKTFLDCPMGILIVDEATYLVDANNYMFSIFSIDQKNIQGTKFGNIFKCAAAEKSGHLCGTFESCRTCALRNGILHVLETGESIKHVELAHVFTLNGRTDTMWFLINAVPLTYGESTFVIISFADITKRKNLEENLKKLGITDELTSLYNRRFIMNQLETLASDNKIYDKPLSVVLLDIDNFKSVNDTYGHLIGDEVLRTLSSILTRTIRHTDFAGRYGGEEFFLILQDTDKDGAGVLVERILRTLSVKTIEPIDYPITFSAGVLELNEPTLNISEVLDAADKLLYLKKADGKNGYYSKIMK